MLVRVDDPADPQRCQGSMAEGQCWNRAEPGTPGCMVHNGGLSTANDIDVRLYHLTEARNRQRLAELTGHDQVHALREVTALAHLLVEKRVNLIQNDADLFDAYRDLNTLQLTVERLCKSAHLIEQNLGVLLGKPTVLRFGQHVIQIVVEELQNVENHTEVVQRIADQTIQAIKTANNHSSITKFAVPSLIGKTNAKAFLIEDIADQVRLAELSKHERIKSLSENIALQIVLIERYWNMANTPAKLISAAGPLSEGLKVLEKLIKSCHEIEQTLGNLLTREARQRLGQAISEIITDELELGNVPNYEQVADKIMDRIVKTPFVQTPRRIAA